MYQNIQKYSDSQYFRPKVEPCPQNIHIRLYIPGWAQAVRGAHGVDKRRLFGKNYVGAGAKPVVNSLSAVSEGIANAVAHAENRGGFGGGNGVN